jgi:TRAP-type C4-dicarboxylate transport system permease small subunit
MKTWHARLELLLLYIGVIAVFIMMCLTAADAVARYVLNSPITGAYEITEKYLMVAVVFLGLSNAYRDGALIRVTFFVDRIPRSVQYFANHLAQLITIAYAVVLIVATIQQGIRVLADQTELSTLPITVGPAHFMIPVGLAVMLVLLVMDIPRAGSGQSHLFSSEAPAA